MPLEILPAIDLRGGRVVRLTQGDYARETVYSDDPGEVARRFVAEGATRLHVVDLDAAASGGPTNLEAVRAIRAAADVPIQLGGGVRDDHALETVLEKLGVDRAIVGTAALKDPVWFKRTAQRLPDRLVLGIDAKDGKVATDGWLDVSETSAVELAARYAGTPVAAVVYTNIANDGMLQGIDDGTLHDLGELADLGLPVIASGGVTTTEDIAKLVTLRERHHGVVGAIVGRALYEGTMSVEGAVGAAG
ncbi:MAG: 1-(5-phosphoribosyl)-5-[(5-phosphoribosylamino)methylideneamino]imidazole-4-carboxamide isomerase [Planctomycetota bacterium]